jgi:glutathione S-transferase
MSARLYALKLSHPAHAARLMLERKGIEHEVVNLLPGLHPQALRALGFRGKTVPALKLDDGRRIQGSLQISAALEELKPDPPLYPTQPEARRKVIDAERWGERVLQDVPRRIFRWGAAGQPELRRWIGAEIVGVPAPRLAAAVNSPVARRFARASDATDQHVRSDLSELPDLLGRVDELIADGTIGGAEPNAADFQILASVRVLSAFPALRGAIEDRPCGRLADRLLPDYPDPVPLEIPSEWVADVRASLAAAK